MREGIKQIVDIETEKGVLRGIVYGFTLCSFVVLVLYFGRLGC